MKELPLINIHSKKEILELDSGKYFINIIGGFLVKNNNFRIKISGISNNDQISPFKTNFPVQSFDLGKRSKRCYEFKIKEKGKYRLEFENSKSLIVKRSNVAVFFPFNLFNKAMLNDEIKIRIIRKSYW